MGVQRRGLATRHDILEQQEGAPRLSSGGFPDVQAPAIEPQSLAFTNGAHDRDHLASCHLLLLGYMGHQYHDDTTVLFSRCQFVTSWPGEPIKSTALARRWSPRPAKWWLRASRPPSRRPRPRRPSRGRPLTATFLTSELFSYRPTQKSRHDLCFLKIPPRTRKPASTWSFRPSCASSLIPSRNSAR